MRIAAAFLAVLIMMPDPFLFCQLPEAAGGRSWLSMISDGEEILVKLESGKKVKGDFISATGFTLQLLIKGKIASFDSASVVQVSRRRSRRIGTTTMAGAAAGALAGYLCAAHGWNDGSRASEGAKVAAIGIPVGAGLGAVIGGLISLARSSWEPVYEKQIND